jgi:hypothetical protein
MTRGGEPKLLARRYGPACAPGPFVVHSWRSNQCVSRSASATFGSVCAGLKTLCSRSAQIATASSGPSRRLTSSSVGGHVAGNAAGIIDPSDFAAGLGGFARVLADHRPRRCGPSYNCRRRTLTVTAVVSARSQPERSSAQSAAAAASAGMRDVPTRPGSGRGPSPAPIALPRDCTRGPHRPWWGRSCRDSGPRCSDGWSCRPRI